MGIEGNDADIEYLIDLNWTPTRSMGIEGFYLLYFFGFFSLNSHAQYGNWRCLFPCISGTGPYWTPTRSMGIEGAWNAHRDITATFELPRAVWELKAVSTALTYSIATWTPTRSMGIEGGDGDGSGYGSGWTPTRSMGIEGKQKTQILQKNVFELPRAVWELKVSRASLISA